MQTFMWTPFVEARFDVDFDAGKGKGCLLFGCLLFITEEGRLINVKEKTKAVFHAILKFITSYKMLLIMWLYVGIVNLASGHITRISYLCVWLVVIMDVIVRILEEEIFKKD